MRRRVVLFVGMVVTACGSVSSAPVDDGVAQDLAAAAHDAFVPDDASARLDLPATSDLTAPPDDASVPPDLASAPLDASVPVDSTPLVDATVLPDLACAAGLTLCSGRCVDLRSDPAHCGACGYAVVSAGAATRTCIGGQPTPGWVQMSATGAPSSPGANGWTGKHLYVFNTSDSKQFFYDPASDTWSPAPSPPSTFTGDVYAPRVTMTDRQQLFLFQGTAATPGNQGYLLDESGATAKWITTSNASTSRGEPAIVYDAVDQAVLVVGGYPANTSADRYNLLFDSWTPLASATGCARANTWGYAAGVAAGFGGLDGSGSICNSSPIDRVDPSVPANLTPQSTSLPSSRLEGPTMIPVGARLFLEGGANLSKYIGTYCQNNDAWFIDPTATAQPVATSTFAEPAFGAGYSFAAWTGRAIFVWGGQHTYCNGGGDFAGTGSIGVVDASQWTIAWVPLPTAPLGARESLRGDGNANTQYLWTGSEILVYSGYNAGVLTDGASYQPPVGCVCPSSEPACASVSGTIPTTCSPK